MTLRVIIVDDEALAREGVELLLNDVTDVEIVGQCENGSQAVKAILDLQPDLVLLDINMPGLNGFEVIKAIGPEQMPLTIFLTAYDEYAIDAFRINALDYLLKPINAGHFADSLNKARREILKNKITDQRKQLKDLLESYSESDTGSGGGNRILVRTAGHVYFIKPEEILWVEAEGDYVSIHTDGKTHLIRETMKNMEEKLKSEGFQRIHRSSLVNLDSIRELIANDNGDYKVLLKNGAELKLSRNYRDILYSRLHVS